jgi:hypothetical protein
MYLLLASLLLTSVCKPPSKEVKTDKTDVLVYGINVSRNGGYALKCLYGSSEQQIYYRTPLSV